MDIEPEVLACMEDMLDIVVKKEEKRLYDKKRYEANREQKLQKAKEYYYQNKEEIAEKQKEWWQTYEGKKSHRIYKWKSRGIITDDYDTLYEHYLKTSFCDACRVELTYDKKLTATTKVVDHDHSITDRPNFRNILCHSCNLNDRVDNTSGVPNVSKNGTGWFYDRTTNGNRHYKYFKTFEEACTYKIEFEENN